MNAQSKSPQQQKPHRPQVRGNLASTGIIAPLALFWHVIGWIWSTIIVGGVLVGFLTSYLTTGESGFSPSGPHSWFILRQLLAHSLVTTLVLIVAVLFTFICYLAARYEKRERQEQQRAQQESLVDIGRGVRKLLEEAQTELPPSSVPSACVVSTHVNPELPSPPLWTVPYRRNPFFTGREDLLKLLHDRLTTTRVAALTQALAISGLGGIGKTQTAVEYAYRYRQEYQEVLWARAESAEALTTSYVAFAELLKFPVQDSQNQTMTVQAVKHWLQTHQQWLLILDNADEPALLSDFLPPDWNGHLLLTTRAQAMGHLTSCLQVEELPPDLGALLLLRRAKLLEEGALLTQASSADRALATKISQELGGLPLALDEAGAYLEATGESLSRYPQIFQEYRAKLLKERRALLKDYPESVATTLLLSFDCVEQKSQAAADLLRLCAFLAPDTIPEEIITRGAPYLGSLLEPMAAHTYCLNQAIEELRNYSLINRNSEKKILSVHRLVQVVLQDSLSAEMRKQWKERVVNAVNATFPGLEPSYWTACERWLPHAFICAKWIEQEQMMTPIASHLLAQAGLSLKERAQYTQAESFLQQNLTIDKQVYGPEHPKVATALNNLACLYWNQGKYRETERFFLHALKIRQEQLGDEDLATAETLQNLACLYQTQGKNEESGQLFQSAVAIDEHRESATVAIDLSNQADLYRRLGNYEEAEFLLKRALALHEKHGNQEHFTLGHILHKQGLLAYEQGKFEEAEAFFKRTREMYEKWLGSEHPNTAQILNALADLSRIQGKDEEAELLFRRALAIKEKQFGEMHSSTAATLNSLALLYQQQGKYVEAESSFQRALEIRQHVLGNDHPNTALILNNLACLYQAQKKYQEAEPLFRRALAIHKERLGWEHPSTLQILHNLIYFYGIQDKYEEAQPLLEQALAVDEKLAEQKYPRALFLHQDNLALLEAIERNTD